MDDLLIRRTVAGLWFLLGALSLFMLRDAYVRPADNGTIYLIRSLNITITLTLLWAIRQPKVQTRQWVLAIGLCFVTDLCVTFAIMGVLRHDAITANLTLATLLMIVGTLLPWGLWPQFLCAGVALMAGVACLHVVTGGLTLDLSNVVVALVIAVGASLYIAYELERYRSGIEQRTLALNESEERFRTLVENANDLVCQINQRGHYAYVSPNCSDYFGYSPGELLGCSPLTFVHPDDRSIVQTELAKPSARALYRFRHKQGEWRWVESTARHYRTADGETGTIIISRDMTERRQMEETLRDSKEYLRTLFDYAPDAYYLYDLEGRFVDGNFAAEAIVGYKREELVGSSFLELGLLPPDQLLRVAELLRLSAQEPVGPNEVVLRHKDGSLVTIETRSFPVQRNGQTLILGVARDITERKRSEAALQQAKDAAEAANRAKSEFLANMSHEIRTPMNGIIGMTELTLNTELSAEQREYLIMVKSSAHSLLKVINDILDFSKVEAGKIELDLSDFALRDTLGDTMKALGVRAAGKGLELAFSIPPAIPDSLVGDAGRLRQVLVNLVANAIKFTARGEVLVTVSLGERTADTVRLEFAVRDTGIGIPPEKIRSIFEPFEQADGSTTRRYGGSGLGLAISARLVSLMGGQIWAESEVGQGSTFRFTACFGVTHVAVKPRIPAAPHALLALPVLVVDDNATNRRILYEMLTNWRMRPTAADCGAAALAELKQAARLRRPYPLVLLDAQMPEMDGFELVTRIKQTPELAGATIMMLSSVDLPGDAARCRALGVAAYLAKPLKQSELLDTILKVLGTPKVDDAPVTHAGRAANDGAPRSLRVLVAEDNIVNQRLLLRVLERHGHTVAVANNGQEAVEAVGKRSFDVVLMDVQMPEIDGLEATGAIREMERVSGGHLPIVAITAHAMKGDDERCLDAGMDAYVSKPINAAEVLALIDRLVPAREAVHSPPELTLSAM